MEVGDGTVIISGELEISSLYDTSSLERDI